MSYLGDDFPSLARMLPRAKVAMYGHDCGAMCYVASPIYVLPPALPLGPANGGSVSTNMYTIFCERSVPLAPRHRFTGSTTSVNDPDKVRIVKEGACLPEISTAEIRVLIASEGPFYVVRLRDNEWRFWLVFNHSRMCVPAFFSWFGHAELRTYLETSLWQRCSCARLQWWHHSASV